MNKNILTHYVEEIWTEFDYKEGFNERKIVFPIVSRENYKALPWVRKYRFFDQKKVSDGASFKQNVSSIVDNVDYNPFYYMDNQYDDMVRENKIQLNLVHCVKETWTEYDYETNKITEREIIFSIKDRENYIPAIWVKQYRFIDFLEVDMEGVFQFFEIPTTESKIFLNKENNSLYYIDNKNEEEKMGKIKQKRK